ncbi:MAG: DNA-binding protein [Rhodospirillales bacterium 20-64-7]|nr:MAG: DNA-binding protein [Rhodospirillales bacterium 20-64-7]
MNEKERRETLVEFRRVVNVTPAAMRHWFASDESRSVGITHDGAKMSGPDQPESVGHGMGQRVVEIKARKPAALTEADYRDMRKVVGYMHRHRTQRPDGDVEDTRWRKSLMNLGHDPMRDEPPD